MEVCFDLDSKYYLTAETFLKDEVFLLFSIKIKEFYNL